MLEQAPEVRVAAFRKGQLDLRPGQPRPQLVRASTISQLLRALLKTRRVRCVALNAWCFRLRAACVTDLLRRVPFARVFQIGRMAEIAAPQLFFGA